MSNLFKPITPDITELKTGTPIIKQGDRYIVAGIGGDFIPGGPSGAPVADIVLGQVNADGGFQALSFNGTEASNSGDPEVVENYYTYNGVFPVPECNGGGGGSCDYYKCASVDSDNKTWNGYKAVWSEKDGYSFEETVTENLSYGSALVPVPGGVYDSNARMEVSKLFEAIKPITTNDTSCLIYIDGTTPANQALAPNKHDVTFGSGVTTQDGYLNIPNDSSGQIVTTAKTDGYGGSLKEWTWDYYFISDASYLDCSGHSVYGWTLEGRPNESLFFRGQNTAAKTLGVIFNKNELIGLSMQYDNGVLHVWNKGKYVGTCTPTFPNCNGRSLGIGCDEGTWDRMADKIKLFRFSNKARYTPGVDFELPEGFVE